MPENFIKQISQQKYDEPLKPVSGSKTVAALEVPLPNVSGKVFVIAPDPDNVGTIFFGAPDVTVETGIPLAAGDAPLIIPTDNLNRWGVIGENATDKLVYLGLQTLTDFAILDLKPEVWLDGMAGITVADLAAISTWEDQSGNGKDGTSVTTERPIYTRLQINKKHVVDFDGADDYMDLGDSFSTTFDGSFTVAMVVQPEDGVPAGVERFTGVNHDANNFIGIANSAGMVQFSYSANGNAATAETDNAVFADGQETAHIIVCVADSTIAGVGGLKIYFDGVRIALDGVNDGDTTGITFADYAGAQELYIGARNSLGSAANFYEGFIAEFMLFNQALIGENLANLHNSLLAKYGLST